MRNILCRRTIVELINLVNIVDLACGPIAIHQLLLLFSDLDVGRKYSGQSLQCLVTDDSNGHLADLALLLSRPDARVDSAVLRKACHDSRNRRHRSKVVEVYAEHLGYAYA